MCKSSISSIRAGLAEMFLEVLSMPSTILYKVGGEDGDDEIDAGVMLIDHIDKSGD